MKPAYPPMVRDEATLLSEFSPFLEMPEAELIALVPPQGGFYFQDCPACAQGDEATQLTWNLSLGMNNVQCRYCKSVLPSKEYPENGQVSHPTPGRGRQQVFRYFEDDEGKKYWFEGRRWYEQRELMEKAAYGLAQLHFLDSNRYAEAGRRAALILARFAEVFPDYIVKFDYPHVDKRFFPGLDVAPAYKIDDGPYRLARWSWWAYMDVSTQLLRAYDLLRARGVLTSSDQKHVDTQLFDPMLSFVKQYDGTPLNNMHPTLWSARIVASRVLGRPALAEQSVAEIEQLIREEFTYDGMWKEVSPSYHQQTVNGLSNALKLLRPDLAGEAFDAWLSATYPAVSRAMSATDALRLPNGHYAPINDSWPMDKSSKPVDAIRPALFPGMGYAILASGAGPADALQAHLKFTGRFGHEHFDSLGLLLWGAGREQLSDIGYTHTKARAWTMATSAHNTVVIDQLNQPRGPNPRAGMGRVLLYNVSDPAFHVVQAEAPEAYAGLARTYRRALISVGADGRSAQYVIDVFEVAGGETHDWFLHGSADQTQSLELTDLAGKPLAMKPVESLVPAGVTFTPSRSNIEFDVLTGTQAYGYFRDVQSIAWPGDVVATFRFDDDPNAGLRSWIMGDGQESALMSARSWAVRGTTEGRSEDESKLDERLRASVMVRRTGSANTFVAVHQPLPAGVKVRHVTSIVTEPKDVIALKVELEDGRVDYFVFANGGNRWHARDGKMKLTGDARIAWAQTTNALAAVVKMIDGTVLKVGDRQLTGETAKPAALIAIDDNRLTLEGDLAPDPGSVIVVRHGDGTTSAFHVASCNAHDGKTIITTVEPPVFTGDPSGPLQMRTFPRLTPPAPHTVWFSTLSSTENAQDHGRDARTTRNAR